MLADRKKIVLITSGQPSVNPRLVKEADALHSAGYNVVVLYQYRNAWATEMDKLLLSKRQWKALQVGGSPINDKWRYTLSRVAYRAIKLLSRITGPNGKIAEFALSRGAFWLSLAAKRQKADLYVAHNLAALPPTVKAAKKFNAGCGFDAEDFHRFEITDNATAANVQLKVAIENKYLLQTNYFTASSSFIAERYRHLYPALKPHVIYNVFPKSDLAVKDHADDRLKLFWFSQTIGRGRGIETVIEALNILGDVDIELHLLGELAADAVFKARISESRASIICHHPIEPDMLITFSSQFDIGLAMEYSTPLNRDICLTNKIFSYLQAGLAIIASDTTAQKHFINNYPEIGGIYEQGNAQSLADQLNYYRQNRDILLQTRRAALKFAHERLNWEQESRKFLSLIAETLSIEKSSNHISVLPAL